MKYIQGDMEPFNQAPTQTDILRFKVKPDGKSSIEYYFSEKVRKGIEIEWVSADGSGKGRFTPDENGKCTQTVNTDTWIYVYYTYQESDTYSAYLSRDAYSFNSNSDIKILTGGDRIITSLDVSQSTALTELVCTANQLTSLDASKNTALEKLYCDHNQLTSLDVSGCTALTELDCDNNQLTSLDVSGCIALMNLQCDWNQLTVLDVSGCTALEKLYCSDNQLTALDVSQNTALAVLDCWYNQLTSLDASKNTALEKLYCSHNQLTALDVSPNTALTELYCDNNQLTALDISQNIALHYLVCYDNQLTSLDVSKNTVLTTLSCGGNPLTSLDVSKNTYLTELYCYNNQLRSLDVSKNTYLTELYCYNNHIPLSDLYKAYIQNSDWEYFVAYGQSDTLILPINQVLDLSSERLLGESLSTFEISPDAYTENNFTFQFKKAQVYTLSIENSGIINHRPESCDDDSLDGTVPTFTYHISVHSEESAR